MKLLLLGGTADGRHLAKALHQNNIDVIYSIAGLVRTPQLDCEIVSGGFTQFGGLENYIAEKEVTVILDVTHPYAQKMSLGAVAAAKAYNIPYWRFHRQPWLAKAGDNWQPVNNWKEALTSLTTKKSVLLTAGQFEQDVIDNLSLNLQQRQLLRVAVKPKVVLPASMRWIKAIGPFSYKDELALMQDNNIDVLVSKNSGGDSTVAKLHAARELSIPVLMLNRPTLPDADELFFTREECINFIANTL